MVVEAIQSQNLPLRVAAGIWLDTYYSTEFPDEFAALVNIHNTYRLTNVDYILVGSETQYRGDFSSSLLLSFIQNISTTVKSDWGYTNIKVTTDDVIDNLISEPNLIAAVDVIVYNEFPFWEGVSISGALSDLENQYQNMVANAQGKEVIIGETGWPDQGPDFGSAVPSPANENTYFQEVVCWAQQNNIPLWYFEAFDAPWETTAGGHDQKSWGLYSADRELKAGISLSFSC